MNNLAVFRCDASPSAGTGHVMRCMALADELERLGFEPQFAVSSGTAETVPSLKTKKWRMIEVNAKGEEQQAAVLKQNFPKRIAVLIVDHYGLGIRFESAARGFADVIAVLEDKIDREHDCDILINSNAGLSEQTYRSGLVLVPETSRLLLGPAYAPMRAEFSELRAAALSRRNENNGIGRVLVSFGGSDPANGTGLALEALERLKNNLKIDVAIGSAAPALAGLRKRFDKIANFHVGTNEMARLMMDADLAIGGGGSTAWERAALGLPTILVTIADNQRDIARALQEAGAAIDLGEIQSVSRENLAHAVEMIAGVAIARMKMSKAAAKLTDGRGAMRIAIALSGKETLKDGSVIHLRRAEPEDQDSVLNWQREPGARRYSRNPNPPGDAEHARWFPKAVNDPQRIFAIVLCTGEPCGFVRLDGKASSSYEVNLLISASHQGRGIGAGALRLVRKCLPRAVFDAHILPENQASVAAFTKAGYIPVAEDLMRSVP